MAFDQLTRNRLARFVSDARRILTDEFTRQCKQDYGIDPDTGEVSDIARLTHLNDTQRATARIVRETLDHYVAGSPSGGKKTSIDRIIREQAFTTLNRLCAVRMAEARGIVIESVGKGPQSKGFALYARVAGSALGETADAYRCYLFSIFDEIALDLPPLFDRFSPKGRLFPSATALDSLLAEINHVDLDPLWGEDETIGWLYQYFNSIEERKQMREESAAPRNSRELAVRNQFFTPRYVVEFLNDNTLGRIWYEMTRGETVLKDTCRYLVRRPSEIFMAEGQDAPAQGQAPDNLSQEELLKQPAHIPHRPLKDPREIRLLDPACGSMHFGLYAFDLFTVIYDEAWELARGPADTHPQLTAFAEFIAFAATFPDKAAFMREVPRLIIEHNIHGIDIDPRAVQIAGLSLWLRAQRAWHQAGVKPVERPRITRSHIVCAEPMPGEKSLPHEFVQQQFQENERPVFGFLLEQVFEQMKLAGEAGSLLRIEEGIHTSITEAKQRWQAGPKYEQSSLFPEAVAKSGQGQMRLDLSGITDEQFWERAEQRIYDALRAYSEKAESGGGFQRRLFANDAAQGFAFIDLCRMSFDVVVMNPPFGLEVPTTTSAIRSQYPGAHGDMFACFVARGVRAAARGKVGAITSRAFLIRRRQADFRQQWILPNLSLLLDLGNNVMDSAMVQSCAFTLEPRAATCPAMPLVFDWRRLPERERPKKHLSLDEVSVFPVARAHRVPFHRILYTLPCRVLDLFASERAFEPTHGYAIEGMKSFDNHRFLRLFWEVCPRDIGFPAGWVRFAKGGEVSPYRGPIHLLLNRREGGAELDAVNRQVNGSTAQVNQASKYWGRPGGTYSRRSKYFAVRALPSDCVFSDKGPAVIPTGSLPLACLVAWLNSVPVRALVHLQANACDYLTGIVKTLPIPGLATDQIDELAAHGARLIQTMRQAATRDETDPDFVLGRMSNTAAEEASRIRAELESTRRIQAETEAAMSRLVARAYGIDDLAWAEELLAEEQEEGVPSVGDDEAEEQSAGSSEDQRDERLSVDVAVNMLSIAIGCAFGRWDMRYVTGERQGHHLLDAFASLPRCQPAALQGHDGLPPAPDSVSEYSIDGAYPVVVAWDGILVDDPEHQFDIERRLRSVLTALWGDQTELIEHELSTLLEVSTVREWLCRPASFFECHLKRYTKSRRQAPIYWPLSTTSGSYTLWFYYHRLTDQTLFKAVNDFVEPKLQQIASQAAALRGRTTRSSADNAELERLSDLEIELKEFREELLHLAKVWKPNLNDGVVITAAPLWRLFRYKPWQKKLKDTWEALEAGEYDWAHLAYSLWPERVREKCKHDKSLAIAHGLEELYQEPPAAAGKKRGRKPKAADPELMEDAE